MERLEPKALPRQFLNPDEELEFLRGRVQELEARNQRLEQKVESYLKAYQKWREKNLDQLRASDRERKRQIRDRNRIRPYQPRKRSEVPLPAPSFQEVVQFLEEAGAKVEVLEPPASQ